MNKFNLLYSLSLEAKKICKPNPAVAAIIMKKNRIIGQGHTQEWGQEHAEVKAIDSVNNLRGLKNSEMWVTLSPCNFWGKTPPCTKAIIDSGIKKLHVALNDPSTSHFSYSNSSMKKNHWLTHLKRAGLTVLNDFPENMKWKLFLLNYDFFKRVLTGLPAIILKYAMTIDGKIADYQFQSQWISNPKARKDVQKNRQKVDAILVGWNTLLQDNPQLNVRMKNNSFQPLIIVWVKNKSKIDGFIQTIKKLNVVKNNSPLLFVFPVSWLGKIDFHCLTTSKVIKAYYYSKKENDKKINPQVLQDLAQRYHLNSIYVEGGAKTFTLFFHSQLVDRMDVYLGNKIIGDGEKALSPFSQTVPQKITSAISLEKIEFKKIADNIKSSGFLNFKSSTKNPILKQWNWEKIWKTVKDFN